MSIKKPIVLVVLDGFGYRKEVAANAIAAAHMTTFNELLSNYPHVLLNASGEAVGLPAGTPGNSLVGHLTLGAGRVLKQPITLLNEAIDDGSFFKDPELIQRFQQVKNAGTTLHLMGLLSDGASHSHEKHLHALLRMAHQQGLSKVMVHAFLDGRDVPPKSAELYLQRLDAIFAETGVGKLASIHGRMYAMDRSDRKEYVQQSYMVLTQATDIKFNSWSAALADYYAQGLSDEFIPPTALIADGYIHTNDALIFFNIRADRARNLTYLFLKTKQPKLLWFMTGISYSHHFATLVLCKQPEVRHTFFDILEAAQKNIFVIAENEKYAHVTYFFNGGREIIHTHETRIILPSFTGKELLAHPEMAAPEITDIVLRSLNKSARDFYLINYANPDMLGHTGNMAATVAALTCIDAQLKRLYEVVVEKMQGTLYIVADHGKAEEMYDTVSKQPRTAHTTNQVYFIVANKSLASRGMELPLHDLADVAPFILEQMHLPVPVEMQREPIS